jgi:hypothetical protein
MTEVGVGPLQLEKHTLPKRVHQKYETLNTNKEPLAQLLIKKNGAQSSIKSRPIPLKDVSSRT